MKLLTKNRSAAFAVKFLQPHLTRLAAAAGCLLLSSAISPAFAGVPSDDAAGGQILPNPVITSSTVPSIGDVNPYGVAFVPPGYPVGFVKPGDVFVSNYNNAQNLQGTGRTIMRFDSHGKPSLFFQGRPGIGLSTALNVSKEGPIFVGNAPTLDGTSATAQAGSILVLNSVGHLFQTITDPRYIDAPWDSTLYENNGMAKLFIANAISGTVSRLDLKITASAVTVLHAQVVASGYMHRGDPATLWAAPTGLVFDAASNTLYVASADDNAVFAVAYAGTTTEDLGPGRIIYEDKVHLHGALAMTAAPNGHLLVTNSDGINSNPNQPSEIVEFTKQGQFVAELPVDPSQGGSFGLAFGALLSDSSVRFAAVDDVTNTLTIWTLNFDDPDSSAALAKKY